ncbi:hypothetical protein IFM89_029098 [Coptis chinensis]|uniref:Uncharacterized protein n=1 Tax=Coptis chinensis TaxID=261450 RepID=A0A835IGY6_9MAGN|nr:hypothetical protein IFM89_029098 [Coptis chinensis]
MSVLCRKRPTVVIQQEGDVGGASSSLSSPPTVYISKHSSCILEIKDTVLKSGDDHLGISKVEKMKKKKKVLWVPWDHLKNLFLSNNRLGSQNREKVLASQRGLSNFYAGKSKSFANLLEVTTIAELAKPENPYNKRRRSVMASKWHATGRTYYSSLDLPSTPATNDHDQQAQRNNGEMYKKKTKKNVSKSSLLNHEHKIKKCLVSPSDDTQRG